MCVPNPKTINKSIFKLSILFAYISPMTGAAVAFTVPLTKQNSVVVLSEDEATSIV